MNQKITLFFLFAVPLFCMAQNPLARQYSYDASGNRTVCAVINMSPPQAPPVPPDSTGTETEPQAANPVAQPTEYFVEKIAQTKINLAKKWQGESQEIDWILKHGCRTLLKQGNAAAMELFGFGSSTEKSVSKISGS